MTGPEVTVVIPALNAADTLGAQLAALAEQTWSGRWEIVVVDNGSTDATSAVARGAPIHRDCELRVVHEPRRGLNVARNTGVAATQADRVAICDADDVVAPRWLEELMAGLDEADVAVGSLEVRSLNSERAAALSGWATSTDPLPSVGREFGFLEQVICGNVAFRRAVWEDVGGFDEGFARGGDDVDFGWRAQLAGFRVSSRPGAVLAYRAREDRRSLFRQYVRDGEGGAHLYAVYREAGMPRRSTWQALRNVGWLLRKSVLVWRADLAEQGHVLRAAGKQWGRLRGSLRHRVWYP